MRSSEKDVFATAGLGVKYFPAPCVSLTASASFRWNDGVYKPSGRPVHTSGFGDPSVAATFDIIEFLRPSMVVTVCPES